MSLSSDTIKKSRRQGTNGSKNKTLTVLELLVFLLEILNDLGRKGEWRKITKKEKWYLKTFCELIQER